MVRRVALACVLGLAACGGGNPTDAGGDAATSLQVMTTAGPVLGKDLGNGVHAFLGIPYAAPPVGANRWRSPQPVTPWTEVRDARMLGSQCPQSIGFSGPGGLEDCLYLNVWTPPLFVANKTWPVFVWIHGGAFLFGSGGDAVYDGAKLAQYGMVVVTLNYRLGMLGFLAHPALDAEDTVHHTSGNYGIEDQLAALQWVHANIAAFDGRPESVTLAGESAGGYSVCTHYASARTTDLFHAAISESGVCASFTAPHADALAGGPVLAAKVGCTQTDNAALLTCLRAVSSDAMLAALKTPITSQSPGGTLFDPTTPLLWPNDDGVAYPTTMAAALAAPPAKRSLILGTNHDEGTLFVSSLFAQPVTDEAEYRTALAVRFAATDVDAIVAHYPVASYPSANDALAAVVGDGLFVCPARRDARAVTAAGATVYRYTFQQALESPLQPALGVPHSAEVPFVFGNDNYILGSIGHSGAGVAAYMQQAWTRFAGLGDPNSRFDSIGSGEGPGLEPPWPIYDAATDPYVVLDSPVTTAAGLKTDVCDFWDTRAVKL